MIIVLKFNPLAEEEGGNILPGYVDRHDNAGIQVHDPNGNQTFVPWSNVAQVLQADFVQEDASDSDEEQ